MFAVFISGISCFILLWLGDLRTQIWPAIVTMSIWSLSVLLFHPKKIKIRHLCLVAVFLRLMAMCMEPTLSDDIYRYIWEGHLITEGGNPYWQSPASVESSHWALKKVNHPHLTTVYPPLTQLIFAGLSWILDSIYTFKGLSVVADLGILWGLFRLKCPPSALWLYALHPLPILECGASGHMESWGVCAMIMALAYPKWGNLFLWLGAMIKLLPGVVLIARVKSWIWAVGATLGAMALGAYFSLWDIPHGASTYAQNWEFYSACFTIFQVLVGSWARFLCVLLGVGLVLYVWLFMRSASRQLFWIAAGFILISPTVHPWYLLWVFPLALIREERAWIILCTTYPLWYVALTTWDVQAQSWDPPWWPQLLSYGSLLLCWIIFPRKLST